MYGLNKKPFIVSCQALEGEALYGNNIMTKMAKAALNAGANFIRTSQIENIENMLKELDCPIIGLIKKYYKNSEVFITPTLKELDTLIKTKVHIIAIDATMRKRPKESLVELVNYFSKNKYNHQLLMADCATESEIINADKLNFDIIATTMRGHTKETEGKTNVQNNYAFLKKARKLTQKIFIGEGSIHTPEQAKDVLEICDGIVVGSAITRPEFITKQFVNKIKEVKNE